MNCPKNHKQYKSWRHANSDMQKLIARAKRTGGDNSWQELNVFHCGDHWHVGRSNHATDFDRIRRRLDVLEQEWDKQNRRRAVILGRMIRMDKALS
jgi:hypothetical protein